MRASHDEVRRLALKACEALGFPPGAERDAARAVCWLEARGLGGLAALHAGIAAAGTGGRFALREAPALLDRLEVEAPARGAIEGCIAPIAALPLALARARPGLGFRLRWDAGDAIAECVASPGGEATLGAVAAAAPPPAVTVEVESAATPAARGEAAGAARIAHSTLERRAALALDAGIEVDDALWRAIAPVAARVLVPASARSRARGAGAGEGED